MPQIFNTIFEGVDLDTSVDRSGTSNEKKDNFQKGKPEGIVYLMDIPGIKENILNSFRMLNTGILCSNCY